MDKYFQTCRSITVDNSGVVEKLFFDENYGFRHIPVLFTEAFRSDSSEELMDKTASYLNCWYDQYAVPDAPAKPGILPNMAEGLSYFRKNIWDVSSWHYLVAGEVSWLFLPPPTVEYLQLKESMPEASDRGGLFVDLHELDSRLRIKPLKVVQRAGELLFIPPFYGYSFNADKQAELIQRTILTEYNHDNLYAYFRKTAHKNSTKQTILEGFKHTKHLSTYETPTQRKSALATL